MPAKGQSTNSPNANSQSIRRLPASHGGTCAFFSLCLGVSAELITIASQGMQTFSSQSLKVTLQRRLCSRPRHESRPSSVRLFVRPDEGRRTEKMMSRQAEAGSGSSSSPPCALLWCHLHSVGAWLGWQMLRARRMGWDRRALLWCCAGTKCGRTTELRWWRARRAARAEGGPRTEDGVTPAVRWLAGLGLVWAGRVAWPCACVSALRVCVCSRCVSRCAAPLPCPALPCQRLVTLLPHRPPALRGPHRPYWLTSPAHLASLPLPPNHNFHHPSFPQTVLRSLRA